MGRKSVVDENTLAFQKRAVELKKAGRSAQAAIEIAAEEFKVEIQDNWKKYPPSYLSNWAKQLGETSIAISTKEIPLDNKPEKVSAASSARKQPRVKGDVPDDLMALAVELSQTHKSKDALQLACERLNYDPKPSWSNNPASFISMWRTRLGGISTVKPISNIESDDDGSSMSGTKSSEQVAAERRKAREEILQSSSRWWERKYRHEAIPVEEVRIGDKVQYYSMEAPCGWVYACVKEMTKVHGQPAFKVFLGPEEYADLQKLRVVTLREVKAAQRATQIEPPRVPSSNN